MLCRHPARVCPHAEADIAEAAGGVGTHPDGTKFFHPTLPVSPLGDTPFATPKVHGNRPREGPVAARGHTLVNSARVGTHPSPLPKVHGDRPREGPP